MRRGEIWTAAAGSGYAGTPRPVVILQDDRFDATPSVTICAFTTDPTDAPFFRLPIEPNATNGLQALCRLMVDKITTVPEAKISARMTTREMASGGATGHNARATARLSATMPTGRAGRIVRQVSWPPRSKP